MRAGLGFQALKWKIRGKYGPIFLRIVGMKARLISERPRHSNALPAAIHQLALMGR